MRHSTCICLCALMLTVLIALSISGCSSSSEDAVRPAGTARVIVVDAPPSALQSLHVQFEALHLFSHSASETTILDASDLPGHIDLLDLAENPIVFEGVRVPSGTYTHARMPVVADSPGNVLRTADGIERPWRLTPRDADGNIEVIKFFNVEAGENLTLLVDICAAASVYRPAQGGWNLRPIIFVQKLDDPTVTVADLARVEGTVLDRAGNPIGPLAADAVVGVIVERDTDLRRVTVTEADPATGEFTIPNLPPGRYRFSARIADQRWDATGPKLPLQGVEADHVVLRMTSGQQRQLDLTIDS